jgi:hypothetical protein
MTIDIEWIKISKETVVICFPVDNTIPELYGRDGRRPPIASASIAIVNCVRFQPDSERLVLDV